MAEFLNELNDKLVAFIGAQPVFFVATAPEAGRINLSPKGMDTFRVIDLRTCCYLDLTGSGNETAAHLRDDGRITLMFNSFSRNPLILRLYGTGRVIARGTRAWKGLIGRFPDYPGVRQIIEISIDSVQTSCGYAVPQVDGAFTERETLVKWAEAKGEALPAYRREKNAVSIDGLPTGIQE